MRSRVPSCNVVLCQDKCSFQGPLSPKHVVLNVRTRPQNPTFGRHRCSTLFRNDFDSSLDLPKCSKPWLQRVEMQFPTVQNSIGLGFHLDPRHDPWTRKVSSFGKTIFQRIRYPETLKASFCIVFYRVKSMFELCKCFMCLQFVADKTSLRLIGRFQKRLGRSHPSD